MQITNHVFVVTGAGNGIGREVTHALLARGGRVAGVDLSAEALAGTRELVADAGERLSTHVVDITDRTAVAALPAAVLAAHGQVDGVVNVAGIIQDFVPLAELSYEKIEKVFAVNFWGVVHMVKEFLPHLTARPEACVVNVSSMGGFVPVPGQTAYGASKAAVKLFTEGLYAELKGTSVAVTVVFPGAVDTGIAQHSDAHLPDLDAAQGAAMSMTTPVSAAEQIVDGIAKGSYRVVIGKDARMLDAFTRLSPHRATDAIAKKMAGLLGD